MCIRDSRIAVHIPGQQPRKERILHRAAPLDDRAGLFGAEQLGLAAVSYTHLDVYKRQLRARVRPFRADAGRQNALRGGKETQMRPKRARASQPVSYTHLFSAAHEINSPFRSC